MKRIVYASVVFALVVLGAQTAAATNIGLMGFGSYMTNGADYAGTFMFGMSGTWSIDVDDSLWPDQADSTARFNYIWDTYFADHYDATVGAQAWYGYFDGHTLPTVPHFQFDTTSGTIGGDCTLVIMVRDWVSNGVLSMSEKHHALQMTATLSVNPDIGTDSFFDLCGDGSISSGNFKFVNPPSVNSLQIVGQINPQPCPSAVEETTWGTIKALYE